MRLARRDVVIVGGGPAGLCAAIRARLAGLSVTVVERAGPGVDKACGEGLMPDGLALLERLGLGAGALEGLPFRGIRWVDRECVAEADFPGEPGMGVRRLELHRSLARRAAEVGAEIRWGETVLGLEPGGVRTARDLVGARFIVGADGLHSRVRRWAGLEGRPASRRRFGIRRHFATEPWSERVEVHWGEAREAYVTPVGRRSVGVAVLWSGEGEISFGSLLAGLPALERRLAGAAPASRDRGAGPLEQRPRAVVRGNLALVGDAAGYLDAITGEGLSLAFHQAFALVAAIERGDLRDYARAHRGIVRVPEALTRLLLAAERRPALRRRLVRALARDRALFERLLAVQVRALAPARLGLPGALRLLGALALPRPNSDRITLLSRVAGPPDRRAAD